MLRIVGNKEWVKRLLQLYKRLVQPYLNLIQINTDFFGYITGNAFRHFLPLRHTHFKTKALRLVGIEGGVKRLLQLYKWLIQPYISFPWL